MKPFLTSKRRILDLLILLLIDIVLYFVWESFEMVTLFSSGFIWNWVDSQDLGFVLENKRYRFSLVKLVINLHKIILSPLQKFPFIIKWMARSLPAGLFWSFIIYFNNSEMPWWMTFAGSLTFEVIQLEIADFKKQKEVSL